MPTFQIIQGDALQVLKSMPNESINCCVTSPPYYGLRDYGAPGQIGMETDFRQYIARLVEIFEEVRRVLKSDGTLWLNLGDSYAGNSSGGFRAGSGRADGKVDAERKQRNRNRNTCPEGLKPKDLMMIPARVAIALQDAGWYLRSDIIWHKPNPMPESVTDRPTKAHEYLFLLSKSEKYAYDSGAIAEKAIAGWNGSTFDGPRDLEVRPTTGRNRWQERKDAGEGPRRGYSQNQPTGCGNVGIGEMRNKRSVWTIATESFNGAHFAVMPTALVAPCILAGCPEGGTVYDPFTGSGTVGVVALRHSRNFMGSELNPAYVDMARKRIQEDLPMFNQEIR